MKKSNGEVRKINRLTEQYRNPDGTLHCPFCGQNKRLKHFSQWFPMYHNQEQFKADAHKKYEGEIKSLQEQRDEAEEETSEAQWNLRWEIGERKHAEREKAAVLKSLKSEVNKARTEAYREICEFLKHYELKEMEL